MYMRNPQGRTLDSFPNGYRGYHDLLQADDEQEGQDFNKEREEVFSVGQPEEKHQEKGLLSRIFPSVSGGKGKLLGELEADDLILIALLIFLLNEGADMEIILLIGFVLLSGLIEL